MRMWSPRVFGAVGTAFRGWRFVSMWRLDARIVRCAIANRDILPLGEGTADGCWWWSDVGLANAGSGKVRFWLALILIFSPWEKGRRAGAGGGLVWVWQMQVVGKLDFGSPSS